MLFFTNGINVNAMSKHSSLLSLFLFTTTLIAQTTTMHKINIAPLLVNHAEEITAESGQHYLQ